MIKKDTDYSKPVDEIDYETKKRKKRRRGEEITERPKKKAPPYKREHLNLLVEDDTTGFEDAVEDGWYDFPDEDELYYDSLRDDHEGCIYCEVGFDGDKQ